MELTDIMPIEKWKQLVEDINTRFGLNGAAFYINNNVLVKSDGWANKLCPTIKAGESRIVCATAQQRLSQKAQEEKVTVIDECDAGLTKFVIPVFADNEFIGMIGGCGCLSGDTEVDSFHVSKLLKKEEEEIKDLLNTVQHSSQERLEETIKYVQGQIEEALRARKK
jgi:ligand-binding sensor protein